MRFLICFPLSLVFLAAAFAQTSPRVIVTVEPHDGAAVPMVARDQVSAMVDGKPARVTQWSHLTGDQSALQLYVAIDDGTRSDVANQYGELRKFINSRPPSTQIGVAYLQNGAARISQPLTSNHALAAKALRVPLGEPGIAASPYIAVSDLMSKWPAAEARREVLLISSGLDPYYRSRDLQNPYLNTAIDQAVRGAIVIHSIYYAGSGHAGHSFYDVSMGQNYLSMLGDGTGGEFYWQGLQSPVSIAPFLSDLAQRLNTQYLLTIDASRLKPGFANLKVTSPAAHASLLAPARIYVPK